MEECFLGPSIQYHNLMNIFYLTICVCVYCVSIHIQNRIKCNLILCSFISLFIYGLLFAESWIFYLNTRVSVCVRVHCASELEMSYIEVENMHVDITACMHKHMHMHIYICIKWSFVFVFVVVMQFAEDMNFSRWNTLIILLRYFIVFLIFRDGVVHSTLYTVQHASKLNSD